MNARITAAEIPKIANYDFVTSISDGELPVCGMAELTGILHPQKSIEGSFEWSQLIPSSNRNEAPRQVTDGFYSIEVEFNLMYNCLPVALGYIESPSEIPKFDCGMERIMAGFSDEDRARFFKMHGFSENTIIDPITHFLIEPSDLQSDDSYFIQKDFDLPPLKQISSGILPENVTCTEGFQLIFKAVDNSPACVKPVTAQKLLERGWTKLILILPKK